MTLKDWNDNPELRFTLRKLLTEAPLNEALNILTNNNFPRMAVAQGADPMVSSALQHARNAGYYDFYRALIKLSEEPQDPRKQLPEPWSSNQ